MKSLIRRFIREAYGQDLVEYAFLLVFIALAVAAIMNATASAISVVFDDVNAGVTQRPG